MIITDEEINTLEEAGRTIETVAANLQDNILGESDAWQEGEHGETADGDHDDLEEAARLIQVTVASLRILLISDGAGA